MMLKFQSYDVLNSQDSQDSEGDNENAVRLLENGNKAKRIAFRNKLETSIAQYKKEPLSKVDSKILKGVINKRY